ncbi:VPLPA-CTERM sorting domain-containing protein [Roseobacter litoralis]|uniref:VPLPA-CTERM protein sorting domain-containing protein n=1 Tax=Roseobacter litoralis (strain ATCC 49566 / DSM 6996 / JCM 21268 / NBRC 15278 / OCh 149) TaxID=391595 RepID=F7ZMJ1_ROSLO|nr:VPLPA-CTERM sorting domain-containing protein [Roseobacter litoralis]AEI96528.1 hypothetical protein RLO149_p630040 [Roseobacter litoralis Och 149]
MNFTKMLLTATFALGAMLTGASAATIVSNVSGNVCEGGVAPAVGAPCPSAFNLGDFNSTVDDPTLEVVGDTRIWGGVAHRTNTTFFDSWTMDFGSTFYSGTFNYQATSANFDAVLTVGGAPFTFTTPPANGSIDIGTLTGVVTFVLNPIAGSFGPNPDEVATWDLELSQVPLPASALLLIAGIGGLGAMRGFGRKS